MLAFPASVLTASRSLRYPSRKASTAAKALTHCAGSAASTVVPHENDFGATFVGADVASVGAAVGRNVGADVFATAVGAAVVFVVGAVVGATVVGATVATVVGATVVGATVFADGERVGTELDGGVKPHGASRGASE